MSKSPDPIERYPDVEIARHRNSPEVPFILGAPLSKWEMKDISVETYVPLARLDEICEAAREVLKYREILPNADGSPMERLAALTTDPNDPNTDPGGGKRDSQGEQSELQSQSGATEEGSG